MGLLAVITSVGRQRHEPRAGPRLIKRGTVMLTVGSGSSTGDDGEDHVTFAIAKKSRFREGSIREFLPMFSRVCPTAHIVAAGVMRFEAGAVEGCEFDASLEAANGDADLDGLVQQSPRGRRSEQSLSCLLKGCEMRDLGQFNRRAQIGRVEEQRLQLAIIEPQKLFQHQAREELRLSKRFWTKTVGIQRQRELAGDISKPQNPSR